MIRIIESNLNMKSITSIYNDLMGFVGREYNQIGTKYSENTDGWNLRDMVAECDYVLDRFLDPDTYEGQIGSESKNTMAYVEWEQSVKRLKDFIKKYEPLSRNIKTVFNHSSKHDNSAGRE